MKITLVWRGVDRNGEALPEPVGWDLYAGPLSTEVVPRAGESIAVGAANVYVQGIRYTATPDTGMRADVYVVPMP